MPRMESDEDLLFACIEAKQTNVWEISTDTGLT